MGYINTGNEKLHYRRLGKGAEVLLAFHGYGQDSGIFTPFEPYLGRQYTMLAFDLPHHGNSHWTHDVPLTRADLATLIAQVQAGYGVQQVSLMGYSIGGRVCATIAATMPAAVRRMVLLATDGLKQNIYYNFFTRTRIGSRLFSHMLKEPAIYFRIMDWMKRLGFADATRHKFVMQFLRSDSHRMMLLQVWPGLSDLVTDPAALRAAINQHHIPVSIFMGTQDRVMPASIARKFIKGTKTVKLILLDRGHRILDAQTVPQIAGILL